MDGCPELDGCSSNVPFCRCRKEVRDRLLLGQKKSFKLWNNLNIHFFSNRRQNGSSPCVICISWLFANQENRNVVIQG